jgi:hypothetical protein
MNTQTTMLDNASGDATTPNGILHAFLAAWWHGNVGEAGCDRANPSGQAAFRATARRTPS